MSNSKCYRRFAVALLLLAGLTMFVVSCAAGGTDRDSSGLSQATPTPTVASLAQGPTLADGELLSTFKSKDPFIQQAVEEPTTTTTGGSPGTTAVSPTTTYRPGTSTTFRPGNTTTTRYYPGNTTTTRPTSTTTTTAAHIHTLKILSVGDVGGAAAVTFQVDSSVYKDKRVGDVVSSSWGQIKVLDLSTASKVATLLHGSETLVLSVGQVVYE
jgi:hypothetical protein